MFTPLHSLFGADLLHLATSQHLELAGRPLGISGILNGSVFGDREAWRWTFLTGMVGSAVVGSLAGLGAGDVGWGVHGYGGADGSVGGSLARRVVAGLLVGFGSKVSVELANVWCLLQLIRILAPSHSLDQVVQGELIGNCPS